MIIVFIILAKKYLKLIEYSMTLDDIIIIHIIYYFKIKKEFS